MIDRGYLEEENSFTEKNVQSQAEGALYQYLNTSTDLVLPPRFESTRQERRSSFSTQI